ncbi:nuclear pore complex protein Nup154 isoform X2 [Scaptodrosophila lebanonensis]|uniref:Nuclear pore complex protein Nup154 isoform X2 n=1 Tax=Drosophila lebanonensis TaxID=7225 RepID=A0A6J2UAM7_DROLE|nr:nuclear pore complex protein Nup154 isoform X2 [Scaptodrosophila lebanonensis]
MNETQVQVDLLLAAGNMLEWHDNCDRHKPGLSELTGISQQCRATMSGLNDYDYQSLASLISDPAYKLKQLRTVSKSAIPNEILEHFKHIKCHCTMGLFPEIGRAWLTIDSEIYVWSFGSTKDIAYYDGLSHLIVSVGLVKPKDGVFVKDVKYLMLLTTPIEVIILGATFGEDNNNSGGSRLPQSQKYSQMQLMNKPIFVLGTDNVSINVIQGSEDGRIFLGGRDGCLYEIYYQVESSWLGKRCKKINLSQGIASYMVPSFLKLFTEVDPIVRIAIDNSRKLLYILTEKSSIEAWDMGTKYTNARRLCKITQSDIAGQAINLIKTVDPSIFKCIKAICPLTLDDSDNLHLVAVTQSGVRLYFSTKSLNFQNQQNSPLQPFGINQPFPPPTFQGERESPNGLYLLHVRLPPGYTPNSTTNKPKQVHTAHYTDGTTFLVTTQQQEQDLLWSVSSAPFTGFSYLVESTALEALDGTVWSLSEYPDAFRPQRKSLLKNDRVPRKIALLTNQGTHIIELLKSADILQQVLLACNGPHHEAVKMFFQTQSEREACATALLLATSDEYLGGDIAMWAAQAFLLYGGEPCLQNNLNAVNRNLQSPSMGASFGRDRQLRFMSTPMPDMGQISPSGCLSSAAKSSLPLSPTPGNDNSTIVYSAKHDGLYLYVSRMLRSIWQMHCVNEDLCSTLNPNDCAQLLAELRSLRCFLETHSVHDLSSTTRLPFDSHLSRTNGYISLAMMANNRNITEQAQIEEKRSLSALNHFIRHACEVIALWSILNEHQFQVLCLQLTAEHQKMLRCCTFRDLLLTRSEVCAFLIIALINLYLKDKASLNEVSTSLRELCPNLYRHEDAITYKATETLLSAKSCTSALEKDQKLRTTLQMCKDAAPTLPLHSICQQFIAAGFYEGVVDLSSTCAAKSDPEDIGIHYYNNDEPSDDREGYTCFSTRMNYYKEVQLMLDHIYQSVCSSNMDQDSNKTYQSDCFSALEAHDTESGPNQKIAKIVAQALRIKDPLLHVTIYEWLLSHDMLSELLDIIEPSLGEFLRRSVSRNPENVNLIDLLWKYYEKNGHHSRAAQILDNLAKTRSENISLDVRIEYLVRAVMCMRNENVGSSITNGILLKELEDNLDIARIQKAVLVDMMVLAHTNREASVAVKELNYALYDISELYQNFAVPFDLWECQLSILNCSHHNDALLIESVWGNIIKSVVESPGSTQERSTRLFSKIELLVREFGESGACFPFGFLIRELELKACQLRLREGTVPEKLVAMNLDVELLLEYYSRMISINERIWANEGNEWHLIQSAVKVVSLLADNPHAIWYRSKRRIVGKAQDIVAVCLNICYQKPDTDRLQYSLKELQSRLQRLVG